MGGDGRPCHWSDSGHARLQQPGGDGARCTARVRKRPFVDEFLKRVSQKYELVVMTAGVKPYAKLVLDLLDKHGVL